MNEETTLSMIDLSASMMCADVRFLAQEMHSLEAAGVNSFHFDVMDGHFVPNLTFGVEVIKGLRTVSSLPFHLHLMAEHPEAFVEPAASVGVDVFIFHLEATRYPLRLLTQVKREGMIAGVAINPTTPLEFLEPMVHELQYLLVMTVEPGFAGQPFVAASPQRVERARRLVGPHVRIAVDGHIDSTTAKVLFDAGATVFVCGTSSLFRSGRSYSDSIHEMHSVLTVRPSLAP